MPILAPLSSLMPEPFRGHSVHSPVFLRGEELTSNGVRVGSSCSETLYPKVVPIRLGKGLLPHLDGHTHVLVHDSGAPGTTSLGWEQSPRAWRQEVELEWEVSLLLWGSPRSLLFRMPLVGSRSVDPGWERVALARGTGSVHRCSLVALYISIPIPGVRDMAMELVKHCFESV